MYPASTLAERTALLHATALEAMRLYGTDITQRMYLVESAIAHPQEVAFCATVPPGSTGEYVETLPATPALSLCHHGAYEDLPASFDAGFSISVFRTGRPSRGRSSPAF